MESRRAYRVGAGLRRGWFDGRGILSWLLLLFGDVQRGEEIGQQAEDVNNGQFIRGVGLKRENRVRLLFDMPFHFKRAIFHIRFIFCRDFMKKISRYLDIHGHFPSQSHFGLNRLFLLCLCCVPLRQLCIMTSIVSGYTSHISIAQTVVRQGWTFELNKI